MLLYIILSHTHVLFPRLKHVQMLQAIHDDCEPREDSVKQEASVGMY
jgi:hypothetical protein